MLSKVQVSSVIYASTKKVWDKIGDFNSLPDWFPSVISGHIEENKSSNQIGCIRVYTREDGLVIRERLLSLDERGLRCTYSLLEPTHQMKDYVGTLGLLPVTDGDKTYIEWIASFNCIPTEEPELRQSLEELFQSGFDALNKHFSC